jgi:type III restriction enzyme
MTEGSDAAQVGIGIPGDGGLFRRQCAKMATGTGKTIVMAMVIAWHVLNKVTYPQDGRFSKNIFVVAPGLTVWSRLAVLDPATPNNYYEQFRIVPDSLAERLHQGKVMIRNWHKLAWDPPEKIARKRSVDKRGAKSNEAYIRDVLGESNARNLLVINDEARHAWRVPAGAKIKGVSRDELEEATRWIGGLEVSTRRAEFRFATTSRPPRSPRRAAGAQKRPCLSGS